MSDKKKTISLQKSYLDYFNNVYKNGLNTHNNIDNKHSFNLKSLDESYKKYPNNLFQNTYKDNKKAIQFNMRRNEDIRIPETQTKIHVQKSTNQKNHNFLNRHQLNSQIINNLSKKPFMKDNRLEMNEIDNSFNYYNEQFDEKTKQNKKLISLRKNFNYNNNSYFKPIQNKQRQFFDFKPENTRLTYQNQSKKENNKKMLSYQELTKEFNKPMFS